MENGPYFSNFDKLIWTLTHSCDTSNISEEKWVGKTDNFWKFWQYLITLKGYKTVRLD